MDLGFNPTETARKFMNTNQVGWIDPDGDVHPLALFEHVRFFRNHWNAIPAIYDLWGKLEEEALERDSERWRDRHPDRQWHEYVEPEYSPSFDDEKGDLMPILMKAIYKSGWGRVGAFGDGMLELECSSEHERSLTRKARDFAELVGRELKVRVEDFGWTDTEDYLPEIFSPGQANTPK
jgi:hypothetical protein